MKGKRDKENGHIERYALVFVTFTTESFDSHLQELKTKLHSPWEQSNSG
jgi:hypothetical protein